ncbi:MAG: hypothetical protein K2H46_09700 [Muribaculaceae bacterium]|nr:hypothetical protein [Muribaculaceae bacterium]
MDDRLNERSEKVRKLLGEIPPSLVRWGNMVLLVIFLSLMAALILIIYLSPEELRNYLFSILHLKS